MIKLGKGLKELVNIDFPKRHPITDKTIEMVEKYSTSYRTPIRWATGKIISDDNYGEWQKRILNTSSSLI